MKIRNSTSKQEKEVTDEEWESIKDNPLVKGWFPVSVSKKPEELKEFEAKKLNTTKEETSKNTSK